MKMMSRTKLGMIQYKIPERCFNTKALACSACKFANPTITDVDTMGKGIVRIFPWEWYRNANEELNKTDSYQESSSQLQGGATISPSNIKTCHHLKERDVTRRWQGVSQIKRIR